MLMTSWDVNTEIGLLHLDKWHQHHNLCSKHLEGRTAWRREECSGHVMLLGALGKDGLCGREGLFFLWLTYLSHDLSSRQKRHSECWTNQRGNAASPSIGFQGQTCLLLSVFFLSLLFSSLPSLFSGLAPINAPLHIKWWFLQVPPKLLVDAIWKLAPKSLMLGSTLNFLSVCSKYWNLSGFWNFGRHSTLSFGFQKSASSRKRENFLTFPSQGFGKIRMSTSYSRGAGRGGAHILGNKSLTLQDTSADALVSLHGWKLWFQVAHSLN